MREEEINRLKRKMGELTMELTFSIFMALAAIFFALALVAALAWHHSGSVRLGQRAAALQQMDPTPSR